MKYKLIALDLDGTLNNDNKEITPKTKDALISAQKDGAVVVLASGRQAPGLERESKALRLDEFNGILLSYNGGKIIDAQTRKVIYEKSIPNELAGRLLAHIAPLPVTPFCDDGEYIFAVDENGYNLLNECRANNLKIKIVENVASAVTFDPPKILISAPAEVLDSLIPMITEPFKNELSFIKSAPFYLECTALGVDKATSLKRLCEILGIKPDEVIAFGDAQNDISMIEFAGRGVAMENACDELKACADEITLSNNNDGIAHTLAKYF